MEPDISLMESIFQVFRQDWVWDFFFDSNSSELDMIRHAVSSEGVATVEVDISTMGTENYAQIFQVGEKHRIMLLTSFTAGALTLGFGINERIHSNVTLMCREKYIGRIVRDDDKGTCLFIAEDFNEHLTEVSYFSLSSPSHHEHVFALFKSKSFRRAMRQIRETNTFDGNVLRKSLVYFYYATEARPCAKCGREAKERCKCKLLLKRKMHAMDMEAEMRCLQLYTGGYKGVASVCLFANGKRLFQETYPSTCALELTSDPDGRRRLGMWALCNSAERRIVSPLAFCMGQGGLRGQASISPIDTFLLASIADSVTETESQSSALRSKKALKPSTKTSDTDVGLGGGRATNENDCDGDLDDEGSHCEGRTLSVVHSSDSSRSQAIPFDTVSSPGFSSAFITTPNASLASIPFLLATPSLSTASKLVNTPDDKHDEGPNVVVQAEPSPGDYVSEISAVETSPEFVPPGQPTQSQLVQPPDPVQVKQTPDSVKVPQLPTTVQVLQPPTSVQVQPPPTSGQLHQPPASAQLQQRPAPLNRGMAPVTPPHAPCNPNETSIAAAPSRLSAAMPSLRSPAPWQTVPPAQYHLPHQRTRSTKPSTVLPMSTSTGRSTTALCGLQMPSSNMPAALRVPALPAEVAIPIGDGVRMTDGGGRDETMEASEGSYGTSEMSGLSGIGGRSVAARIAPNPHAKFIFPLTTAQGNVLPVDGGVGKTRVEMDERSRKAEQRKARNRESAQRSNYKRKVRIQALKDDIAAATSREMYLRAKEKMLREENTLLRKGMMSN